MVNFDKLLGMEALWKMAIQSNKEKAKEISQELLASMHLKLDTAVGREVKETVVNTFVSRCMQMLSGS